MSGRTLYRAKTDRNQSEIIAALRSHGATVQPLHSVGKGCPDLLVGFQGRNYLIEVKDGDRKMSDLQLKPTQQQWHEQWAGQVTVVETVDQVDEFIAGILTG